MSYLEYISIVVLSIVTVSASPVSIDAGVLLPEVEPAVVETCVENEQEVVDAITEEKYEEDALVEHEGDEDQEVAKRFVLTENERILVERVVMSEAGYEPYEGQLMIAQCILDGAERNGFDITTSIKKYQMVAGTRFEVTDTVRQAVSEVFDNGIRVTEAKADIWYNPEICTSRWHESQQYVCTIGHHKFFWCNNNAN